MPHTTSRRPGWRPISIGLVVGVSAVLGLSPVSLLQTHTHADADERPVVDVPAPPAEEDLPTPPPPPDDAGESVIREDVESLKGVPGSVDRLTDTEVIDLEEVHGVRVVENYDGLIALEFGTGISALRVAAYEAVTREGESVIALAFLDSADIQELTDLDAHEYSGLGPQPALGHVTSYGHYHYFWHGSYVYNYANSWNVYVWVSPTDTTSIRIVGSAIVAYVGGTLGTPLTALVGVLVFNIGVWAFQNNDGSVSFYIPYQSIINDYGNVFYYGAQQAWYYFYSQASSLYCWARKIATGQLYYTC